MTEAEYIAATDLQKWRQIERLLRDLYDNSKGVQGMLNMTQVAIGRLEAEVDSNMREPK